MPSQQPANVEATFYAQVEPRWRDSYFRDASGERILEGAAVVALTQTKPKKPRPGVVVTKLTLQFPAGAFLPLSPEAVVVIPESLATVVPLQVRAEHPGEVTADGDDTDPVVAP